MKNNIKCSICKGNLVPFGFESNDIIIWGNNPQPFNNENGYNHLEDMQYIDIDNDPSTFSSSSADLEIPNPGQRI